MINAIVATRMTSTRLPGKVLMDLGGQPALVRLIERIRKSKYINRIVIATTTNEQDDIVKQTALEQGVLCFRGSEEDVLLRTLQAAEYADTEYIVQITSDCPLIDAYTIDLVIERMLEHHYLDYVTNHLVPTFPLGFAVEVFRTSTLRKIEKITNDPADREHVALYYYEHPEEYHLSNVEAPWVLRHPEYRLTLDTAEDYRLISNVFEGLYSDRPDFQLYDIVKYIKERPELLQINKAIKQKTAR